MVNVTGQTVTADDVRQTIRSFILTNFLPGEAPETLTDSTLLVTSGVITSLSMLELVDFIEDTFSVTLDPADFGVARMDSVNLLVELVLGRLGSVADSTRSSR
jgi:acyl carrier protein